MATKQVPSAATPEPSPQPQPTVVLSGRITRENRGRARAR